MRHIADLVPRQLHLVARITPRRPDHLALGDELILGAAEHLLVADPLAPHVVAVLPQDVAHLFVQAVFYGQFFSDDVIDDLGDSLGIRCLQYLRRELANNLAREIANEFSGEQHPLIFLEAYGL